MARRSNPQSQAIDTAVGKRVRLRRQMLKMSQSALAKKLGITFQQLQKCEQGVNRIGAGRLYQIATLLDVPVDYFFKGLMGGKEPPEAAGASLDLEVTPQGMRLLRAFLRIEDSVMRRQIADLVDRFAGE